MCKLEQIHLQGMGDQNLHLSESPAVGQEAPESHSGNTDGCHSSAELHDIILRNNNNLIPSNLCLLSKLCLWEFPAR